MRLAPSAVSVAHTLAKQLVKFGDVVIDATAGNGHDTNLLAQLVGPQGYVYAFDIQQQAILATKANLSSDNLDSRVEIIRDGHENLDKYVKKKPIKLVMFNLGYLPKGDKKIVTRPTTTLEAIKKSLSLLQTFGAIILTVYTGHSGGLEEWQLIKSYLNTLPKDQFDVILLQHLNRNLCHPFTVMVQSLKNFCYEGE
jgi:tRNA G37 N-methylase Trm5